MGHFYFLLGLGALLLLSFGLHLHRRFGRRGRLPYVADEVLFTPPQRVFLAALEQALGPDYRVYGRVPVAAVIGLRRRLDRAARRRAWARLWNRQFDFLVCAAATGTIACAVNLAPRSRLGRPPPRDMLDRICAAAGLPLVRVREADDYVTTELARQLFAAMQAQVAAPAPGLPARTTAAPPRGASASHPHSVSELVVEDAREPRLRPAPARPRVEPPTPAPAPAPAAPPAAEAPRVEPTLAGHGDLDPGPAFHIDGALDDDDDDGGERAVRARRL